MDKTAKEKTAELAAVDYNKIADEISNILVNSLVEATMVDNVLELAIFKTEMKQCIRIPSILNQRNQIRCGGAAGLSYSEVQQLVGHSIELYVAEREFLSRRGRSQRR